MPELLLCAFTTIDVYAKFAQPCRGKKGSGMPCNVKGVVFHSTDTLAIHLKKKTGFFSMKTNSVVQCIFCIGCASRHVHTAPLKVKF